MSNLYSKKSPAFKTATRAKGNPANSREVRVDHNSEESEDFQEDAIDEFEDYEQDEDSRSARRTESEKSFAAEQKQRMTGLNSRSIKKYRDSSVEERRKQAEVKHYQRIYNKAEDHQQSLGRGSKLTPMEGYSPERNNFKDIDEFEGEDIQRELVKRTTNEGIEEVEVIVKEMRQEDAEDLSGNKEYVDEYGNRYIYHDTIIPNKFELYQYC